MLPWVGMSMRSVARPTVSALPRLKSKMSAEVSALARTSNPEGLTVALRCVTLRQESGSLTVGNRVHRVWLGSCRFRWLSTK